MPSWIYYLCIFFLGAGGNCAIAYCCNMENNCLPTPASLALGIILGLTAAVGYIYGKTDED